MDVIAFTEDQAKELVAALSGISKSIVVLRSSDVYPANDLLFRRIERMIDPTPLTELPFGRLPVSVS
jgi:hypothetical protein